MNDKDELHALVKSLETHEKRFFKRYVKFYNPNKLPQHVYLFDILDNMEHFDKTEMLEQLSKTLPGVNVSKLKLYLKHNIFNSLKAFDKKNSFQLKANEDINTAKILMKKQLFTMAEKLLFKIKGNIKNQEKFHLNIKINQMLVSIEKIKDEESVQNIKLIQKYIDKSLLYSKQIVEVFELNRINNKVSELYNSKQKLKETFKSDMIKIIEVNLAPFNPNTLLSNTAKYLYHNLLCTIYGILERQSLFLKELKKLEKVIENPFFKNQPEKVLNVLLHLLNNCNSNKDIEAFYVYLKRTQMLLNDHPELKNTEQFWVYLRELEFISYVLKEKPGKKLTESITEISTENQSYFSPSQKNYLLMALARCYFLAQSYNESQDLLLQITLEQKVLIDEFHYIEIYIMEILCFYESKSYRIALQKWNKLKRDLRKANLENQKLNSIINEFGSIIKQKNESIVPFKKLDRLIKLNSENLNHNSNLYFLSIWINQKLDFYKA